jgi:hypothetical protein
MPGGDYTKCGFEVSVNRHRPCAHPRAGGADLLTRQSGQTPWRNDIRSHRVTFSVSHPGGWSSSVSAGQCRHRVTSGGRPGRRLRPAAPGSGIRIVPFPACSSTGRQRARARLAVGPVEPLAVGGLDRRGHLRSRLVEDGDGQPGQVLEHDRVGTQVVTVHTPAQGRLVC